MSRSPRLPVSCLVGTADILGRHNSLARDFTTSAPSDHHLSRSLGSSHHHIIGRHNSLARDFTTSAPSEGIGGCYMATRDSPTLFFLLRCILGKKCQSDRQALIAGLPAMPVSVNLFSVLLKNSHQQEIFPIL
ncbi:hypothetical protein L2E82_29967 [Cichorium intybus]|uniref:Uncharacterized protein n=1 Tax=Cichorium intybus TaxID=13427 RepID=A0ACB9CZD3_CICIN|nr:hypothetical protein L2E82_29967 [Cichorium intybus]